MVKRKTTQELVSERPSVEDLKTLDRFPIYFILDNVRSLENVGLIFRLADALRVKKLFLTGITGYPPMSENDPRPSNIQEHAYNQISKTGIKLVPFVDWAYVEEVTDVIKRMKEEGIQIISVEQTHGAKDFREVDYKFPKALVFGHEREGVTDEVLNLSDEIIDIPMYGLGNSLNIATAVAVVGYEITRKFTKTAPYKI
jgi:23S rRNA (guanosine2251-2'-O)-methyltransferase